MAEATGDAQPQQEPRKGPPGVVPPAQRIAASAIARLNMRPPVIWLVAGPPSNLRSEIARAIAASFSQSAHIEGDTLAGSILRGRVLPGETPQQESERQVELAIRNQCLLARSFAEAGFTPVLEYAVLTRYHLDAYRGYLSGGQLRLAVVPANSATDLTALMRDELAGVGHWIDGDDASAGAASALESDTSTID